MSSLLPNNVSAQEKNIEAATARIGDVPLFIRETANPYKIPAQLLPWLAWAYSVDEWSADWTEAQKREAIRLAAVVQKYKGTIGAVRDALGALGFPVRVQEWFNQIPEGDPYTFDLLLEANQTGFSQAAIIKIFDVLNTYKNLRSHLSLVRPSVTSTDQIYIGGASMTGSELTVATGLYQQASLIFGFRSGEAILDDIINVQLPGYAFRQGEDIFNTEINNLH